MTREEAKELFRSDKDSCGKPKHIMRNIDRIYDDFEKDLILKNFTKLETMEAKDLAVKKLLRKITPAKE